MRQRVGSGKRWVVKVGSSLVAKDGHGLNTQAMSDLVAQLATLVTRGKEVILVSSGAVAEGMNRLGWKRRPRAVYELQAAAAIGQMGLIQTYESYLHRHGLCSAQVLLTHQDLQDRRRYLNARTTLRKLLELKVVPVINENDTVSTDGIRFGDNDTLAALTSNLVEANTLVLLTDAAGVHQKLDEQENGEENTIIDEIFANDPLLDKVARPDSGKLGRGWMLTKVSAARIAARAGASTIIASGKTADVLLDIASGKPHGSLLLPDTEPLAARKQWIANQLYTCGELMLDDGACNVIINAGKSLLPIGVKGVKGGFDRGEVVSCVDSDGREIARGLANYSASEARRLRGKASNNIEAILGYADEPELIHRDNLVVL